MQKNFGGLRQVIVNADDFGLSKGINEGIIESIRNGIVTSVSVMPNGSAFEDGVERICGHSGISIGVHLNLLRRKTILPPEQVLSLIDSRGNLLPLLCFTKRLLFGKINLDELEEELSAQIEKVLQVGLKITHLDSHRHIHLLKEVLKVVIKVAKKYNITKIRCPLNNFELPVHFKDYLLNKFAKSAFQKIRMEGLSTPDRYYDFIKIENLKSLKKLPRFLQKIPPGIIELCCHPGFLTEDLDPAENIIYDREKQVQILTDKRILEMMKEMGVRLVSYQVV